MNQNVDLVGAILDCTVITGSLILIFGLADKKQIRERWANCLLVATGLILIVSHLVRLSLHTHWLVLS